MRFSDEADEMAATILRRHAEELGEEAARIARRAEASEVSSSYVERAAFSLTLKRRRSAGGDVFLSVGLTSVSLSGSAALAIMTSSVAVGGWINALIIGLGSIGFLMIGAGAARKLDGTR